MFTPSFTPGVMNTLFYLEESRGEKRISPPGDNFTPGGKRRPWSQSLPLGVKLWMGLRSPWHLIKVIHLRFSFGIIWYDRFLPIFSTVWPRKFLPNKMLGKVAIFRRKSFEKLRGKFSERFFSAEKNVRKSIIKYIREIFCALFRVARFFLVQTYQNSKNMQNDRKLYQMIEK
jgi:hypothetical protein